jgi:hypothetical protein
MQISASFTFEAASIEEARQIVAGWSVTAGTTLMGLYGSEAGLQQPIVVEADGPVGDAVRLAAQQPAPEPPDPIKPSLPEKPEPPEPIKPDEPPEQVKP